MKFALMLLIAVVLEGWCPAARAQGTLPTSSANIDSSIKRGAVIQLKEGTALKFQAQIFRGARPNEEFVVLDVREDKLTVFVSGTDKAGSEIALSAPLPAATSSAHPDVEIARRMEAAVAKDHFVTALALTASWGADTAKREEVAAIIDRLKSAETALKAATNATSTAEAEAKKAVRDAAIVAGRGNNATFVSAAQSLKIKSEQKVKTTLERQKQAMADKEAARKALHIAVGSATQAVVGNGSVAQPAVEKKPSEQKAEAERAKQNLKQWLDDAPIVPAWIANRSWDPSYENTLVFINERISPMKLWFGEKTGKMILQDINAIYVFDPSVLSTDLKLNTSTHENFSKQLVVSKRSGTPDFLGIRGWEEWKQAPAKRFSLPCADDVEAEKLAKAMQHLIHMFGGKKDLF